MAFIRLDNVSLTYRLHRRWSLALPFGNGVHPGPRTRYVEALKGVELDLQSGDRLGLIGINGAGKTSLLYLLCGIYPPTEGKITSQGRIDALFNIRVGFRPEATGRRNILLRGLVNGRSRDEVEARIDDIIAFSELGDHIDLPFKAYSQGMAARLAFATATAFTPDILLMDEWIGAGDAPFQKKAGERMRAMADEAAIMVIASHNESTLTRSCNKGLVLDGGRVAWSGPIDEALRYYKQELAGPLNRKRES